MTVIVLLGPCLVGLLEDHVVGGKKELKEKVCLAEVCTEILHVMRNLTRSREEYSVKGPVLAASTSTCGSPLCSTPLASGPWLHAHFCEPQSLPSANPDQSLPQADVISLGIPAPFSESLFWEATGSFLSRGTTNAFC